MFPYLIKGIKDNLADAYFTDMNGEALAQIEHLAQQCCQGIGLIGYYYPAEIFISEHSMLYAKCELSLPYWSGNLDNANSVSVAMKSVSALDGKL